MRRSPTLLKGSSLQTLVSDRLRKKATPKNRHKQEIAGYREGLNILHENFGVILVAPNAILQLHKILYSRMNNPMDDRTLTLSPFHPQQPLKNLTSGYGSGGRRCTTSAIWSVGKNCKASQYGGSCLNPARPAAGVYPCL